MFGRSAYVRAPPACVKTRLAPAIWCAIAASLVGCAGAPPVVHQPPEPTLVEIMERLSSAQDAYRRIAEARNSVVVALGALQLRIDVEPQLDVPNPCPDPVRALAQRLHEPPLVAAPRAGGEPEPRLSTLGRRVEPQRQHHAERLTHGLYLLDAELERDGHGSLGCSR